MFLSMRILVCVLATLALAVHGQNDDSGGNSSDDGTDDDDNTNEIVATSVIVSVVVVIVVGLTVTMWVCACCRPEKGMNKRLRQTGKWHWRSNLRRRAVSSDMNRLPMGGLAEANERKKSLDVHSMELGDSKLWRSSENIILDGSCDDLYASQNYVHSMNYSENENDFQTLNLDETLFENPSSRSRSEAHLSNVVFSNTTGLQAKAKKLDDLSSEKVLEFYDLHTPKNSPRKNKVSSSTGDLPTRPTPSLSDGNLKLTAKQTESPLVSQQQENTVTVTIEQTDCIGENIKQIDDTSGSEQTAATRDECTESTDQMEPVSIEIPSLQISKDHLREALTGTPDSGVVLNDHEESSTATSQDSDQSFKQDNTIDSASKSDVSSSDSLPHHSTPRPIANTSDPPAANREQQLVVTSYPVAKDATSWETVADRKKRYLQTVEHSTVLRKTSTGDHPTSEMVSSSVTQAGVDSDHGNSEDEESTATLSSSQPLLNLTSLENPKPSLRDDSDSDSDSEEMQSPLASTKLSPHTVTETKCTTNPLLSDSSDEEDCEMVQPSEVVVHRSSVKGGSQEMVQHRASHPPLQRTLNHEQTFTPHHTKKRRHKPSLKSILEEDSDTVHHTNKL